MSATETDTSRFQLDFKHLLIFGGVLLGLFLAIIPVPILYELKRQSIARPFRDHGAMPFWGGHDIDFLETELRALRFYRKTTTDADLKALEPHFQRIPSLMHLSLRETEVSDAGLIYLKALPNLSDLTLANCHRISDAGLDQLKALTNLRFLHLDGTAVTLEGVGRFVGDYEKSFGRAPVIYQTLFGKGYARVQFKAGILVGIQFDQAPVTPMGMSMWSHWRTTGHSVGDSDLSYMQADLEGIPTLEHLGFLGCYGISDAGLVYLRRLKSLRELDLRATSVTDAGVNYLRRELPGLKIIR